MGFFEFKNYGYYALIMAETEGKAVKFYKEEIADISEEDGPPDKITEEQAKEKMLAACDKLGYSRQKELDELNQCIKENKAHIILVDSSLT